MFGFLKKTIGNFVEKITGKPEAAPEEPIEKKIEEPQPEADKPFAEPEKIGSVEDEILREAQREIEKESKPAYVPPKVEQPIPKSVEKIQAPKPIEIPKAVEVPKPKPVEVKPIEHPKPEIRKVVEKPPMGSEPIVEEKIEERVEQRKPVFEVKEETRELKPKVGLLKKITGFFTGSVKITEKEVEPLFEDLKIALLESDVSLDTTEFLVQDLHSRLVGKQIAQGQLNDAVKQEVKLALLDLFGNDVDFLAVAREKQKPVKILFLGPNGAGKTTTIAKFAFLLKQKGFTSVIAASDTFRAAAIEQASIHGEKLGVRVIKHNYGADPAAVAFDAIAHAKAEKLDFVLIDTAGRQETNINLVKEMEKINRVIQPDFKVFVGESVAGHALIDQAKAFHEAVKLDGLILTKIDADAKGGTAFSIANDLKIPILFIGMGQEYTDLKPFSSSWLVDNVLN